MQCLMVSQEPDGPLGPLWGYGGQAAFAPCNGWQPLELENLPVPRLYCCCNT